MKRQKIQSGAPAPRLTLTVLSGLHEGAVQSVCPASVLRIGAGGAADLMLADDGLEPVHAELSFGGGFATLKALHGGVALVGPGAVTAGKNAAAPLPAEFSVGGVRLRCDGPPPKRHVPWRRGALVCLSIAGLLVSRPVRAPASSMGIVGAAKSSPAAARPDSAAPNIAPSPPATATPGVTHAALTIPAIPAITPPEPARPRPMSGEAAAVMLSEAVQEAGLTAVRVSARGSTVVASGILPPTAAKSWQAVRESFDRRTAGRVVLANEVQLRAEQPFALAIDSVWTGNYPNIVIGGAKYLEGGVLPNGWTLDRIEKGKLSLHRAGATVVVAY